MIWSCIGLALVLLCVFFYLQNNVLTHTRICLDTDKLEKNIRIVLLSDMHSKIFSHDALFIAVMVEKPDLIIFAGDIADRYKSDKKAYAAVRQLSNLTKLAPVVAVTGNHEYGRINVRELFDKINNSAILLLRSESTCMEINGQSIEILGLDELGYHFKTDALLGDFSRKKGFKLLISHFPHLFEPCYSQFDIDLTLSGHAHGGQFILPFIGGLYAPGQGLFPKYYRGSYKIGEDTLVVSRGLGNSRFPLRLFNYPDVVTIDLLPRESNDISHKNH